MAAPAFTNTELKEFIALVGTDPAYADVAERLVPENFDNDGSPDGNDLLALCRARAKKFGAQGLVTFGPQTAAKAYRASLLGHVGELDTVIEDLQYKYETLFANNQLAWVFKNLPPELAAMGDRLVPSAVHNDGTADATALTKLHDDRVNKYGKDGVIKLDSGAALRAFNYRAHGDNAPMDKLVKDMQEEFNTLQESVLTKSGSAWKRYRTPAEKKIYRGVWLKKVAAGLFGAGLLYSGITGMAEDTSFRRSYYDSEPVTTSVWHAMDAFNTAATFGGAALMIYGYRSGRRRRQGIKTAVQSSLFARLGAVGRAQP